MEEHHDKIFKYKLDFYYQSALMYLLTLIVYGGIRGKFIEKEFVYVLNDPIMYIILAFVLISIATLALNYARNRRLIIQESSLIFANRFRERRIELKDIEWMHIGRERLVQTSGIFQVIVLKLKGRRRLFRIRIGRYEKEKELMNEMNRIALRVPKSKRTRWSRPRFTDR